jgi:hypothetical protein
VVLAAVLLLVVTEVVVDVEVVVAVVIYCEYHICQTEQQQQYRHKAYVITRCPVR